MKNTLRVSNLPLSIDATELDSMFTMIGKVVLARVEREAESQRSRGFGFVEMSTLAEALDCIRYFNGKLKEGLPLDVREAVTPNPIPGTLEKRALFFKKKERILTRRIAGKVV